MFETLRASLGRVGRRTRFVAAGACLLLAAVSALESSRTAPTASRAPVAAVVVAAGSLPAGRVLREHDLRTARLPVAAVPAGALRQVRTVIGRRLAGPIAAREVLVPQRLVGAGLAAGLGEDTVATPVGVDTDVGGLVRAGDLVELVATPDPDRTDAPSGRAHPGSRPAETIVDRTRVLAVLGPAQSGAGTRLVLAVSRRDALRIAAAHASEMFTVVVIPPSIASGRRWSSIDRLWRTRCSRVSGTSSCAATSSNWRSPSSSALRSRRSSRTS